MVVKRAEKRQKLRVNSFVGIKRSSILSFHNQKIELDSQNSSVAGSPMKRGNTNPYLNQTLDRNSLIEVRNRLLLRENSGIELSQTKRTAQKPKRIEFNLISNQTSRSASRTREQSFE